MSVGNKVYFFVNDKTKYVNVYSYDVEKNVFSFKSYLKLDNSDDFHCTKVPVY